MEQLIRTQELCTRLGLGKDAAQAVMAENGVFPIRFGVGRGRGTRWLASAVDAAIRQIHQKAQPTPKEVRHKKQNSPELTELSIDQLFSLTHA